MVGCTILGCKSRSERKIDGITFHSFPSIPEIKQKWLDATGRQNWQPTKHAKICSIHFNEDLFLYKEKSKHLKPYSIPIKDIHIANSAEQMLDNVTLTQPSTGQKSLDEPGAVGVKRRTDYIQKYKIFKQKSYVWSPTHQTQPRTSYSALDDIIDATDYNPNRKGVEGGASDTNDDDGSSDLQQGEGQQRTIASPSPSKVTVTRGVRRPMHSEDDDFCGTQSGDASPPTPSKVTMTRGRRMRATQSYNEDDFLEAES